MPEAVVDGAVLECSSGTAPGTLKIDHAVRANGSAVATVADHVPLVNIPAMGQCKALGMQGCVPNTTPWQPSTHADINGLPMIDAGAICNCQNGGVIRIVQPGTLVTINGSSPT
jgi:hypothetical protein